MISTATMSKTHNNSIYINNFYFFMFLLDYQIREKHTLDPNNLILDAVRLGRKVKSFKLLLSNLVKGSLRDTPTRPS